MNIFFLDIDFQKCAEYHVDAHVRKMRIEYAQMACMAHHVLGSNLDIPYKPITKHKNHPSTIWVRESIFNYQFVIKMGLALCEEMRHRFGTKYQKTEKVLQWLLENPPNIENNLMTKPRLAIGGEVFEQTHSMDYFDYAIKNYHSYYNAEKVHLFKWTKREKPEFLNR